MATSGITLILGLFNPRISNVLLPVQETPTTFGKKKKKKMNVPQEELFKAAVAQCRVPTDQEKSAKALTSLVISSIEENGQDAKMHEVLCAYLQNRVLNDDAVTDLIGWDLIDIIFPLVHYEQCSQYVMDIMLRISNVCSPREIVLTVLSRLDILDTEIFGGDVSIHTASCLRMDMMKRTVLFGMLKNILSRTKFKRRTSILKQVLDTLRKYMSSFSGLMAATCTQILLEGTLIFFGIKS